MVLVLTVPRLNVVKATNEAGEVMELEDTLDEVLLALRVMTPLRLEYALYSEDDVFDETLRLNGELSGKGIPCGGICGCGRMCGCGCPVGPLAFSDDKIALAFSDDILAFAVGSTRYV